MGLLDDAIREHLEFKRRRGADPDEVARQENDALGVVDRPQEMPSSESEPGARTDLTGEETAELDMSTVLQNDRPSAGADAESLEWEMPGETRAESPGQGAQDEGQEDEEEVEDVLEETPDFLRETPDQDRLWFEQQPPRDFDFDK